MQRIDEICLKKCEYKKTHRNHAVLMTSVSFLMTDVGDVA